MGEGEGQQESAARPTCIPDESPQPGQVYITNVFQSTSDCFHHICHTVPTSPPPCIMATSAELDFVTLDVFTSKPYQGNPLAIVRIPSSRTLTQEQKQAIAREFNLSETTFLHENAEGEANLAWTVDIFMTSRELPFAGHPTVGTACYVLGRTAQAQGLDHGVIEAAFSLKSGPVRLQYDVAKKTAKASIPHDVYVVDSLIYVCCQVCVCEFGISVYSIRSEWWRCCLESSFNAVLCLSF